MDRANASRRFRHFLRAREGVSALEYAILVGIITVGIGTAVAAFSGNLTTVIGQIATNVTGTASNFGTAGGGQNPQPGGGGQTP